MRVVTALLERQERYLITQRRANAVLPGLWEFPGGKCEEGETDAEALKRELRERLDAEIQVGQLISYITHPYEHYSVELYLYECRLLTEALQCKGVADFRWVTSAEFDQYPFPPPDEATVAKLLGEQDEHDDKNS